jgi:hypothetical protein
LDEAGKLDLEVFIVSHGPPDRELLQLTEAFR